MAPGFDAIYRTHVQRIYRYCYARLRDRARAEDATSDTFLNALRSFDRFEPGSNITAWLFVIARNVTTDQMRVVRRSLPQSAANEVAAHGAGPEQAALDAEAEARVRAALESLATDQRAAIELQLAGWSLAESAEAMGKSAAAVKMLRMRGIARLRALLDPEHHGREIK